MISLSILFKTTIIGIFYIKQCQIKVSVLIVTPSIQSITSIAPSQSLRALPTSSIKLGCPGVSMRFKRNVLPVLEGKAILIGIDLRLIYLFLSSSRVSVYLSEKAFGKSNDALINISIRQVFPLCKEPRTATFLILSGFVAKLER